MSNEMVKSERFTNNVIMQYTSEIGKNSFGEYEQMLCQHLFIKIDYTLKELMAKTNFKTGKPVYPDLKWENINMAKLAIDSVNRIQLGLDGLISGHIYPIAYKNSKTGKYDIDLRIGYKGELIYRQNTSKHPIKDIRIEIVYENDKFVGIKKDCENPLETYLFKMAENAFQRGNIIGGYGYIEYEDESKNKLITVDMDKINKAKNKAQTKTFWDESFEEMVYKTIARRTASKIEVDPTKINGAFFEAENNSIDEIPEQIPEIIDITDDNKIEDKQEVVKDIPIEEKQTENNIIEPGF